MRWILGVMAVGLATMSFVRADDAAKPVAIEASDKTALAAAMGKDVLVSGTIKKAQWSSTGKVMNIDFENSDLLAAVFEKNKETINKAKHRDIFQSPGIGRHVNLLRFRGPEET